MLFLWFQSTYLCSVENSIENLYALFIAVAVVHKYLQKIYMAVVKSIR